jgi:hypothetical protein
MDAQAVLVCLSLLEARRSAESDGRLDFSAVVETDAGGELTPVVHMGSPYAVGRITFTGHETINDSTLRRAMTLHEHEVFDVGKLRRSLARINESGLVEPLTVADIAVTRRADPPHDAKSASWGPGDGVTADITIPLRERGRRWWSLSGPIIPGLGSYHASISARLPPWGRSVMELSTYVVTFNLLGLARPLAGVLPLLSKAPVLDFARASPEQGRRAPAALALERPYLPGQGLRSGFAVSPQLSPRATMTHYGRTQLSRLLRATLADTTAESLAVPITGSGPASGELLVCTPPQPRLRWLRRGVLLATDLVLAIAY